MTQQEKWVKVARWSGLLGDKQLSIPEDPAEDLNWIHEAEKRIPEDLRIDYCDAIMWETRDRAGAFRWITATAENRINALVKVIDIIDRPQKTEWSSKRPETASLCVDCYWRRGCPHLLRIKRAFVRQCSDFMDERG